MYTAIVDDPEFLAMGVDGMLLYFFCKLQLGPTGIDRLRRAELMEQLNAGPEVWSEERLAQAFAKALKYRWIVHQGPIVWIRNALLYERTLNRGHKLQRQGIESHLRSLPRLVLVNEFAAYYEFDLPFPELGLDNRVGEWSGRLPSFNVPQGLTQGLDKALPTRESERENKSKIILRPQSKVLSPDSAIAPSGSSEPEASLRPEAWMWDVMLAQGMVKPAQKLTDIRREKLRKLYDEQLKKAENPADTFALVCDAVKAHRWWGARPGTWLPEKCFRNAERREEFALLASGTITQEEQDADSRGTSGTHRRNPGKVRDGRPASPRYEQFVRRGGRGGGGPAEPV